MANFHPLKVTDLQHTIRNAVVVTLKPADGSDFTFIPGQYLTFRKDFDGQELRRSYSICSGSDDEQIQVGIKKVGGGAFSSWANSDMKVGDILEAMPPMGNFHTPLSPETSSHYLFFATGSGITPILSIIRSKLAKEPDCQVSLVYSNRAVNTIMFREEIEDLKNVYLDRFVVIHVLGTDAQEIDLFTGRVNAQKCGQLFQSWIDIGSVDTAFICGPEPMMLEVAGALREHGLADDQIKYELFASAQPGRLTRPVADTEQAAAQIKATIIVDGTARTIEMDRSITILDAARAADIDAPYACKAGVCSTCKCRVIEGEVDMVANHALEDYEVEKGFVLSCQSFAISGKLIVDYDQH